MQTIMPPINTEDGLFHEGNPAQGTQGTIVTGLFLNNIQGAVIDTQKELTSILIEAGMLPDGTKHNQVLEAINKVFTASINGKYLPITGGTLTGNVTAPNVSTQGGLVWKAGAGSKGDISASNFGTADRLSTLEWYMASAGTWGMYLDHRNAGISFGVNGSIRAIGSVYWANEACYASVDGNIYGPVWGGWLSGYIATACQNATQAAQNWAYANLVSRIQRGAQGSMTMDGSLVEAPVGCVLTGGNGNEGTQVGVALYRPLQIMRGGIWMTIEA
jgi:hypothetical protein